MTTHAYSGSVSGRRTGNGNPWLPVTPAVEETLREEWADRFEQIFFVARVESGARDSLELDPGDRREIYIIEAEHITEKLVIREDGVLLHRIDGPDFHAYRF